MDEVHTYTARLLTIWKPLRIAFSPQSQGLEAQSSIHVFRSPYIALLILAPTTKMVFSSNLMLLSMFFISSIHAAAIPRVARRNPITGRAVQSHGLSTEALLTLIGVCVAVLGLVLTLVQLWPSLRIRWGLCTSRQLRRRSRFHPISTCTCLYIATGRVWWC